MHGENVYLQNVFKSTCFLCVLVGELHFHSFIENFQRLTCKNIFCYIQQTAVIK